MTENNTAIVQNLDIIDLPKAIEDLNNPETIFAQDEEEDELDFPEDKYDEDLDPYSSLNLDEIDE